MKLEVISKMAHTNTGRAALLSSVKAVAAPRVTLSFLKTLTVFVNNPSDKFSGADICNATKLMSGTVYPLLFRMEEKGWLLGTWEQTEEGKQPRKVYVLTRPGLDRGRDILSTHLPQPRLEQSFGVGAA